MRTHPPREILHHEARGFSDWLALALTKGLRLIADSFFSQRYGHRAVVLETVAGVPGMVGGMLNHLKSLRLMRDDEGWIKTLLDEAENERMHLMTFVSLFQPSWFERLLLLLTQAIFWNAYFFLYLFSPKTAHRMVGYFEEEAVYSYTQFLAEIDASRIENVRAPQLAIEYWKLPADARLRDVVVAVRADEAGHRDMNHAFSDQLRLGQTPWRKLKPA